MGVAAAALVGAACAPSPPEAEPVELTEGVEEISPGSPAPVDEADPASPRRVDPRKGSFEIGFGEYAVTLEAPAIRPGPVTFEVTNGGKLVHGFEMEAEGDDGDSSGPGSGDGFKIERPSFEPGESIRVDLNLTAGVYKIECWVANHDDLGMEILLEVRPDAPKVRQEPAGAAGDAVSISGFAFQPANLQVAAGTEVTWTNDDPEAHTVTADDGSFDSGALDPGAAFSTVVDANGTVTYICRIHPAMQGAIIVR
ncbi:MAG: cupredoxin domain-containing protein [Actinomycetota bacterium]|nr:cupredoxin domain-containing protein [Actinomycetota bacterium]